MTDPSVTGACAARLPTASGTGAADHAGGTDVQPDGTQDWLTSGMLERVVQELKPQALKTQALNPQTMVWTCAGGAHTQLRDGDGWHHQLLRRRPAAAAERRQPAPWHVVSCGQLTTDILGDKRKLVVRTEL